MEPEKYQRKWEELNRSISRIKKFYTNYIEDGEDSFQGPKDFVINFFRISYELKESLKNSNNLLANLKGHDGEVEKFVCSNQWISLSIDIANQEKHIKLDGRWRRSGKSIGTITSHVHIFDPNGKDRTEMKIEIDGQKEDCLELAEKIIEAWKTFLVYNNLIT